MDLRLSNRDQKVKDKPNHHIDFKESINTIELIQFAAKKSIQTLYQMAWKRWVDFMTS